MIKILQQKFLLKKALYTRQFYLQTNPTRIFGYKRYLNRRRAGRALLSYLPDHVLNEIMGIPTVQFSNAGLARTIPRVLNELGFEVDIVDWQDTNFTPSSSYDLYIQHGGVNFRALSRGVGPKTKVIYFSTGNYWGFHNKQEEKRFQYFESRNGVRLPPDRYIFHEEEEALEAADTIISLGNEFTRSTYSKYPNVYTLSNACFVDNRYYRVKKDYSSVRYNFLFFAGGGNIHKGLDLSIEAFLNLPEKFHLYIVTPLDSEVANFYHNSLRSRSNIHLYGFVEMRTSTYYDILDKCCFSLLPSCSEGSAGSMIESMNQGLIPILTKEVGIDVNGHGFEVQPDPKSLAEILASLSSLPTSKLARMSMENKKIADSQLSSEEFKKNFLYCVTEALS